MIENLSKWKREAVKELTVVTWVGMCMYEVWCGLERERDEHGKDGNANLIHTIA
jgi:hypothetical protein